MTWNKFPTGDMSYRDAYRLISGTVVPRPIAWVTSRNPETELINLAPFSFFTVCSVMPPMICFAVERRADGRKDTVRNIEDTGEFIVHIAPAKLVHEVSVSGKDVPADVSEVAEAGLHLLPGEMVQVPRLEEAPVAMECRLHQITQFGLPSHSLVVGHILLFHIRGDVSDEAGRIDFDALDALGRLAGNWYTSTRDRIREKRL